MAIFKSKEERKQEKKMAVRQSMKELEKRIKKLDSQKEIYIQQAQIAVKEDLPEQVELAKKALQMTITERKRTLKMLLNARIIEQMNDMTEMTTEFLKDIHVIAKQIAGNTTTDVRKINSDLKMAMGKVEAQTESLEDLMDESQDTVGSFADENAKATDDEINALIYGNTGASAASSSIDAELAELQRKLGQ